MFNALIWTVMSYGDLKLKGERRDYRLQERYLRWILGVR